MASGKITSTKRTSRKVTSNVCTTFSLQEEVENGKNRHAVRCPHCSAIFFKPGVGVYKEVELPLPYMKQKSATSSSPEKEVIKDYWVVESVRSFCNVGHSRRFGDQYLVCPHCREEPIGWLDLVDKEKTCYVALSRVQHVNE